MISSLAPGFSPGRHWITFSDKVLFYHPADGTWANAGNWGGYYAEHYNMIADNDWWLYATNGEIFYAWCSPNMPYSPFANPTDFYKIDLIFFQSYSSVPHDAITWILPFKFDP